MDQERRDAELEAAELEVSSEPEEGPPEPPKAASVLLAILEKAKEETKSESETLLRSIREREEQERKKREEEERQKAEEARRRVEEERRKREAMMREFEERKARREAEAKALAEAAQAKTAARQVEAEKKSRVVWWVSAVLAVLVLGGVGAWLAMPKGEPVVFPNERLLELARPGENSTAPVAFGPSAVVSSDRSVSPEQLVLAVVPRKYEPQPPKVAPKVKRPASEGEVMPRIKIETGILDGKKVVK